MPIFVCFTSAMFLFKSVHLPHTEIKVSVFSTDLQGTGFPIPFHLQHIFYKRMYSYKKKNAYRWLVGTQVFSVTQIEKDSNPQSNPLK